MRCQRGAAKQALQGQALGPVQARGLALGLALALGPVLALGWGEGQGLGQVPAPLLTRMRLASGAPREAGDG